jgi:SAM-dependent methyltransferase
MVLNRLFGLHDQSNGVHDLFYRGEEMSTMNATRGHGFLENYLAVKRARQADSLIPPAARDGRVLDIGFGAYPYFLSQTIFREKYGVDQFVDGEIDLPGITLSKVTLNGENPLPYESGFFDAVTLLAVIEHLEAADAGQLLREARRVLKPGGTLVLTTPVAFTGTLLEIMARLHLVSSEEIDDHKETYTRSSLRDILIQSGFDRSCIRAGHFELFMNLWAAATNGSPTRL